MARARFDLGMFMRCELTLVATDRPEEEEEEEEEKNVQFEVNGATAR